MQNLILKYERSLSKLSENHKIVDIGSPDSLIKWGGGFIVEHLSTAITLVPLIQCQNISPRGNSRGGHFVPCLNLKFTNC